MLRWSATAIKDYLECEQRFWYRVHMPEKAKVSVHVVFGRIMHDAVEKFGRIIHDDYSSALEWSLKEWDREYIGTFADVAPKPPKSFSKQLKNYFEKIKPLLPSPENHEVEKFFRLPWEDGVQIVGKIDLAVDGCVYDWKTGRKEPSKYDIQSIQFYIYEWAYEQIYDERPKVFYGHLEGGKLIPVPMKDTLREQLPYVINRCTHSVNLKPFRNTGYQCGNCFYRDTCFAEMDDGIALEY